MAVKKQNRGKVLAKVNGFDIREVFVYEGSGTNKRVKSSSIAIFAGRTQLKNNLKNRDEAIECILKSTYDKRKKEFI